MKIGQFTSEAKWRARTRDDLIVEIWQALDCEALGARELEYIQQAVRARFGDSAVTSPASIARTLAEEGAVLRHPEVLDFDSQWREDQFVAHPSAELSFASLREAIASMDQLEIWRKTLEAENSKAKLARLHDLVLQIKKETLLIATSKVLENSRRRQAEEIVHWLTIWLDQPALFCEWLSLRRRSPEFVHLLAATED